MEVWEHGATSTWALEGGDEAWASVSPREHRGTQVLNLVPWNGVEVTLRHLCFAGLHGWPALAEVLAQAYIQDITANQAR